MVQLPTLAATAVGIWFAGCGTYFALLERLQYKFRHAGFVVESMKVLEGYPQKEKLLGDNIKQLRFDLSDDFNKKNEYMAQMVIPVVGSKTKGKLYTWSTLHHDLEKKEEKWRVDRVDLMLHNQQPFTFYRHPDADYVHNVTLKENQLRRLM
ncbi:hypothetical protein ACF0H5_023884 [Mactra antiquata]